MVHATTKVLEEKQGWLICRSVVPAAVGEFFSINFDEAGGGVDMCIGHFGTLVWAMLIGPKTQARWAQK